MAPACGNEAGGHGYRACPTAPCAEASVPWRQGDRRGGELQRLLREVQGEAGLRRRGQGQRVRPPDGARHLPRLRHEDEPHSRQGLSAPPDDGGVPHGGAAVVVCADLWTTETISRRWLTRCGRERP